MSEPKSLDELLAEWTTAGELDNEAAGDEMARRLRAVSKQVAGHACDGHEAFDIPYCHECRTLGQITRALAGETEKPR